MAKKKNEEQDKNDQSSEHESKGDELAEARAKHKAELEAAEVVRQQMEATIAELRRERDDAEQRLAKRANEVLDLNSELERIREDSATGGGAITSPRAAELVFAVPAKDRLPLLGDLLVILAPRAGETGANETAADVLRRKMDEASTLANALEAERKGGEILLREYEATRSALAQAQTAMVARRDPDADWELMRDSIAGYLRDAGVDPHAFGIVRGVENLVSEWRGLRAFLSPQPLVAVAVRNDGTPDMAERYSLLVLEWDGKQLSTTVVEKAMPWGDIATRVQLMVSTRLVPEPFRA